MSFRKHLEVLKVAFCCDKTSTLNGQEVKVLKFLNVGDVECQHGLFKLTMKSNAIACMAPFI